ncbi:MAG: GNAT family N-acetyltransferase [Clostridiales bacterium]|nr:GNAT family N-acetyltransferase [Clostridiales bacterium]
MKTLIRRAREKDIPGINKLLGQVLYVHHTGRPDIFKEKGQKYTAEQLKTIIMKVEDPVFVCVDEQDTVLGHCFCKSVNCPEGPATWGYRTLYIDDLCVDEDVRGQHIGTALYEYAKQYALENGYHNLTLHAWECNPEAVEFYRHLGMSVPVLYLYLIQSTISSS